MNTHFSSTPPRDWPWNHLIGKTATRALFHRLASGLSIDSQIHALFAAYELNPELFEQHLDTLAPRTRSRLLAALAISREYALYRERAFQEAWHASAEEPEAETSVHESSACSEAHFLLQQVSPAARHEAREWLGFWVRFRQGHWSRLEWIEKGVRTHVNFDAGEFFARVLAARPRSLVLIHNHPSGRTEPSWVDHQLTEKIGALSRQFGIELLGHWIVGPHSESWIPYPQTR